MNKNNYHTTTNKLLSELSTKELNYLIDFGDNCEENFNKLSLIEQVDGLINWAEQNKEIERLSKYEYLLLKSLYYNDNSINLLCEEWKNGIRQPGFYGGDLNKHMQYLIKTGLAKNIENKFVITDRGRGLFEKINF